MYFEYLQAAASEYMRRAKTHATPDDGTTFSMHSRTSNTGVIDIQEGKVIRALPSYHYVALSYVREPRVADQEHDTYMIDSSLDLSRLPQATVDAIAVCAALDERYL
jgi:hypothetical protein